MNKLEESPEYEDDTGLQMVQYAGAECIYLSDVEKALREEA